MFSTIFDYFKSVVNSNQKIKEELAKNPECGDAIKEINNDENKKLLIGGTVFLGALGILAYSKNSPRQRYLGNYNNGRRRKYLD